jgi:hypothetical protein
MDKLEELHLDVIETNDIKCTDLTCSMTSSTHTYAVKSSEITTDVAVKFADYIAENWIPNGRKGCWDSRELNSQRESKYLADSTKALFEEFINNYYNQ